eukprot:14698985-Alexandrium_andersonii.AAC.1
MAIVWAQCTPCPFQGLHFGHAAKSLSCKEADVSLQLSRSELDSTAASLASQWRARWLAVEDEPP